MTPSPFQSPSLTRLFLFGTEDGRALRKTIVSRSTVTFFLPSESDFQNCKTSLRDFATVLRNRPAADVRYGWGPVYLDPAARQVWFDILWYDIDFFTRRQNAFMSRLHEIILARFGISPADLTVVHGNDSRGEVRSIGTVHVSGHV